MHTKTVPFSLDFVKEIAKTYPTPFVIYDKQAILKNAKELYEAFSRVKGFKNYFAVKATPNPTLIHYLKES
jgi:diaminopimelate decarboxylase